MTHRARPWAAAHRSRAQQRHDASRWRFTLIACRIALGLLLATTSVLAADADAGADAGAQREVSASATRTASDSPRASLDSFLTLCRAGRYTEAAAYLDLSGQKETAPATLARRMKAVLDRHWVTLADVSGRPEGALDDGLPPDTEQLTLIPSASEGPQPVQLRRDPSGGGWRFSAGTVARIDEWYGALGNRWLLDRLPEVLLRPGPRNVQWWQWLAFPVLLAAAGVAGAVASRIARLVLRALARRTTVEWDDAMIEALRGPATLAFGATFALAFSPFLELYQPAEVFFGRLLRGVLLGDFFWALSRLIDIVAMVGRRTGVLERHPMSRTLIPLATRVCKLAVLALAIIAFLSELGYPVASLIAGLGLGGLAFALAAQKTVENLFGAFSIGADQPFREGDFVKVDDFVGTVELIGLRSTKIRTLDRTLVSVPNGVLAEKRLESYSARDRIRLACTLGLVYETTADQMRKIIDELEAALRRHPKIWPDAVVVRFVALAEFALNIDVMCWFLTPDWNEFQLIRQEVLLEFMGIVERAGTRFAFPRRAIHLTTEQPQRSAGVPPSGELSGRE
jgi:MscS family membrane protein